eukprot:COSAG06_NODE_15756_length_1047_cov_1.199367_2_plen_64_part_01
MLELVAVPVLDHLILASTEEVVSARDKAQRHDGVVVGKDRLVAIAKVKSPDLDVLVGGTGDDHL